LDKKSLPRKCLWYPAHRVPKIPHRNANAVSNINACLYTVGVYSGLSSLLFRRTREGQANIELGQSGFDSKVDKQVTD
jgi:hypothetical protein